MSVKQIIFVVETNKQNSSDDRYIKKLIDLRYSLNNDTKIRYVHMDGKEKYRQGRVINEIDKHRKNNKNGENHVIYCFDTDNMRASPEEKNSFMHKKDYCYKNLYDLIWFNTTIEFVILNKDVHDKNKKDESIKFLKSDDIKVDTIKLSCDSESYERQGYSNFYQVLDKYLLRK